MVIRRKEGIKWTKLITQRQSDIREEKRGENEEVERRGCSGVLYRTDDNIRQLPPARRNVALILFEISRVERTPRAHGAKIYLPPSVSRWTADLLTDVVSTSPIIMIHHAAGRRDRAKKRKNRSTNKKILLLFLTRVNYLDNTRWKIQPCISRPIRSQLSSVNEANGTQDEKTNEIQRAKKRFYDIWFGLII